MKAILICPAVRPTIPLLAADRPLATVPALGQRLLEYWMSHLALNGVKQAIILSNDRTEEVGRIVGKGLRWGVAAEVIHEARELDALEATEKYQGPASLIDHFPGLPTHPLFGGYYQWFKALEAWLPSANTPDRVGLRELRPGVWAGLRSHVSTQAILHPPCWLADHVYIGPGAVVGPRAILEEGAFIEAEAEIKSGWVGPATFVGRYVRLEDSLAWGSTVVDMPSASETKISDPFVLCSLQRSGSHPAGSAFLDRIADSICRWMLDEPLGQAPELVKR
jgi:NDP-sugar pyrophosphorylase family protein